MKHRRDRWLIYGALFVLLIAATVVRVFYIQRISLYFDEFTTLWAAKTVLERGLPLFPSGNFYTHGLLFTYLEAPFFGLFGLDEAALRLPSLVISVGTVLAIFLFGRQLFSEEAGLIAAAAVAMDPEAIAWGSRVRMYALLALLVLLAVYLFYQAAIANDRPGRRWLAIAALVAAIFTHVEAALFLPALALAVLVARGVRWTLRPSVVGPFVLGAAGFLAAVFGLNVGQASHLEAIHEVRPYLTLPTSDLLMGLRAFAPAFADLWRLPFTVLVLVGLIPLARSGVGERRSPFVYLYVTLSVVLAALFFLAGPTWQTPRYAFMILPLFWLLAGAVLARGLRRRPIWVSVLAAVLLAVWVGVLGYRSAFTQEWGYDRAYRYLQQVVEPGDVVLTANPAACALYLEECGYYAMEFGYEEYVMPGSDGEPVDRWVALPLLDNVEQLRDVLRTARRVWLVVDGWRFQSRFDHQFVRTVLDQMTPAFDDRGMAVFVGQGYAPPASPATVWPVRAQVDRELALEGVELSSATLQPGDELGISLLWRRLDSPRTAYTVFLHLVGPDGQQAAQIDELLLDGYYQPTVWPKGEIVVDRHRLALPQDLAPGRYRLEMGLYPPEDPDALLQMTSEDTPPGLAPSTEGSTHGGADRAVLGYLVTEGMAQQNAQTLLSSSADFNGQVRLLGYTSDCQPGMSGCSVQLFWQPTKKVAADYTVFVHLVGADGRIVAQHDGEPENGFYPTSAWMPGETVVDSHHLDLPANLPPGDYRLLVGLYQSSTNQRLPVLGPDGIPLSDHIVLTTIR